METKEEVAAWAMASYRGDASFVVHHMPTTAGLAASFWEGLRSHFIQKPFLSALGRSIARLKGEVSVSIPSQHLARKLYGEHAESFLREMYCAHNNGQVLFDEMEDGDPVLEWVRQHMP